MSDSPTDDKLIVKRTFEDTLTAQEELRDTLEMLIEENRCLTKEERGLFLRQFAHATLGLGREESIDIRVFKDHWPLHFGSVEYAGRSLAMKDKPVLVFSRTNYKGEKEKKEISISFMWERLLYGLFNVFPLALDRATAMSKEHDATTGGEPYEFKPRK